MRHATSALLIPVLLVPLVSPAAPAEAGVNRWTPVGPEGGRIFDLAVDSRTETVYAATSGGVFVSTNGGGSWVRRHSGLQGFISQLAVSSVPSSRIYAANSENVYTSTDGGLSWTSGEGRRLSYQINSIEADPSNSSTVYAGTYFDGVLKSSDGGASWTQAFYDSACGSVDSLAIDPRASSTLYASCGNGLASFFKSTDGGDTWVAQGAPLPEGGQFLRLVLDSGRPGVVYVTARVDTDDVHGLVTYRSTDDGASWTRFGLSDVSMLPGPPGVLFMGMSRSTDGGATWQELDLPAAPRDLAFAPGDPATLYAGTAPFGTSPTPSGVYKSTDAGATWSAVNRGLVATEIRNLEVAPQESTLYALAVPLGLSKGPQGGRSWQPAGAGLPDTDIFGTYLHTLAIDPQDPANLYFSTGDFLTRSTDGGASWSVVSECVGINSLLIDPQAPDRLYASGSARDGCQLDARCAIFRSDDAGASWTCISLPQLSQTVDHLVLAPSQPSRLYAIRRTEKSILVSQDRGATWKKLKLPRSLREPTALTVDPKDARRLYLGSSDGRLYKSANRGTTWTESSHGLPASGSKGYIVQIVVDPQRPQTVYVANAAGVYASGNGGATWRPLNSGLPSSPGSLVLDPQNPRKLYAGTASNGIYVLERR